jgi:CRP-like cAMP-binding protein
VISPLDLPLFAPLDEAGRTEVERLGRQETVPAEATIYREREPVRHLYVLLSGGAVLIKDTVGQPVQLLRRLEPGDPFGVVGLVEGGEREATARATDTCRLWLLSRQDLMPILSRRPMLRLQLRRAVIEQTHRNIASALDLASRQEVRVRVSRPVCLRLDDGSAATVTLENLSIGGAALADAPAEWTRGRRFRTMWHLPDGAQDAPLFTADCEVAWRKDDRVGLRFAPSTELSARISSALYDLLPRRDRG